ncbi:FAD-dependent monooxygenase [Streptomyces sp. NPDC057705]|uniref:FAD-dependent monooxygenase n=1 Tax=Streptomyces sp. NPDC057705 TaxID=3346222 RepID=UPI0036804ACA
MTPEQRRESAPAPDVLVVGAGPVGLVVACELVQQGIPVRLVDASVTSPEHSRAAIVWPRILEQLRRIGAAAPLIDAGHQVDGVSFYSEGSRLGSVSMNHLPGTPYRFALTIPQNVTESVLEKRLLELGGSIERGVTLERLTQGPQRTRVSLRTAEGTVEEAEYGWVVGADGAHSTVRKQLGIAFEGEAPDLTFAIADAPVEGGLSHRMLHYLYSARGAFGLAPLDGVNFRLAVSVPHREEGAAAPSRELFQERLEQVAPGAGTIGDLHWSTTFRLRCRTAAAFRQGRCFLAGDAAHIMSPAGGQGMNTGLIDAVSLGWRLAGVIRGRLADSVLDEYDAERRAAAHRITRTTGLQTRWGLVSGRARTVARDGIARVADTTGLLQRVAAPVMSQLDIGYAPPQDRWSAVKGAATRLAGISGVRPGTRLPVFVAEPGDEDRRTGRPRIAGDRLSVLLWPGVHRGPGWAERAAAARAAIPAGTAVVDLAEVVSPDLERSFPRDPAAAVVRPDGHLAAFVPLTRPWEIAPALRRAGLLPTADVEAAGLETAPASPREVTA